jgi:hypothetical protein
LENERAGFGNASNMQHFFLRNTTRREMAPQQLEKIESAPGNGMGSEASNPQDMVHGHAVTVRVSG